MEKSTHLLHKLYLCMHNNRPPYSKLTGYSHHLVTPANVYRDVGGRATQEAKAEAGVQGFHQK